MAASPSVYTGFWMNWSEGPVKGATLTLTNQHGAYLVAFLALFVQLSGVFSWQILSYFFFHTKASPEKTDELTRQHLAIFRNVQSDLGSLWELIKASWQQRHATVGPFRRILTVMVIAGLHGIGFTIAGILSSRVTSTTSVALLRSESCGTWNAPLYHRNETDQSLEDALWESKWDSVLSKSANFAAACYNTTKPSTNCNAYGRHLLSLKTSTHRTCPFDSSICVNETVVRMDSGYVDSLLDSGINSSPSDRVTFRKVVECAPLKTEGFTKSFTSENLTQDVVSLVSDIDTVQSHIYEAFYYGRNLARDSEATFVSSNRSFKTFTGSFFTPYRLHSETSVPRQLSADSVTNTFAPIAELNRTDAEVVLIFMANQALYTSPVTDPMFEAQDPLGLGVAEAKGYEFDVYTPRQTVSVLGCTDQTEVCNPFLPAGRNCTAMPVHIFVDDLSGLKDALSLNSRQMSILRRFSDVIQNSIDASFAENGDGGMLAGYLTDNFISAALPDNQWILELQNWFVVFLTMVQLRVTEYVTGFDNPQFNKYMVEPKKEDRWMCTSQMAQRRDYASFSVLGLGIILGTGLVIMILNFFLNALWRRFHTPTTLQAYRLAEWDSLELLELQRAAENTTNIVSSKSEKGLSNVWLSGNHEAKLEKSARSLESHVSSTTEVEGSDDGKTDFGSPRHSSSAATIDIELARGDFPSQDLSRLMSRTC